MGVGLAVALAVEGGLPLTDHAQHRVVEDDRDDGQLIADSGAGFVEVHVEGAVAGEHHHPLVAAQRHLCADGCTVAEAHGSQTAAGNESAALGVADILRRPHLVLTHIGNIYGLGAALVAHLADDLMGHQAGRIGHGVIILRLPLVDHGHPLGVLLFLDLRQHGVEHISRVAHDGEIHFHVLAQLTGVDVDLDDGGVLCKGLGVQRHTVRETGAHRDQNVAVGHSAVGGVAAVHTHHADVHRVAIGHNACGHQGVGCGDLGLVQQIPQRLAGSGAAHAAAEVHQRTLGSVDEVGCPLDLLFIKGSDRADLFRLLGGELADSCGHVLGDVHQHRAFAAALCDAERGPHGIGQLFHPAHREVVLGDRHRDALDVSFLEAVLAQTRGGHVAGKGHHGHRVHISGSNAGDQIGSTRAAGGQHHAGAAGGAGVAVRCVGRTLLMRRQHMGDAVGILIQLIVEVQHRTAGITKNGIHALLAKNLHKNLRTVQLHGELLLFPVLKSTFSTFPRSSRDFKEK